MSKSVKDMHKGSMQYWPRRRAQSRLPRVRAIHSIDTPCICNIIAYKAGMTHLLMTDDSESVTKGAERSRPCTVIEIPETSVYGIRFYSTDPLTRYRVAVAEISSTGGKALDEGRLGKAKSQLKDYNDITALLVATPNDSVEQHHYVRFESQVGGKSAEDKFNFISSLSESRSAHRRRLQERRICRRHLR